MIHDTFMLVDILMLDIAMYIILMKESGRLVLLESLALVLLRDFVVLGKLWRSYWP
jgi:hypothetical protein